MSYRIKSKFLPNPDPDQVLRWLGNGDRRTVGKAGDGLAEDGGFLFVEFFVGEDTFVVQLFELAQLVVFIG